MKKKKSFKAILNELMQYDANVEASKSIAYKMTLNYKSKIIPDKKKYSKKDRRKNKRIDIYV